MDLDGEDVKEHAEAIYEKLVSKGVEVLYDDRVDLSPGEKLGNADLIGIPWRLVVSKRTKGKVEMKKRLLDAVDVVSVAECVKKLAA